MRATGAGDFLARYVERRTNDSMTNGALKSECGGQDAVLTTIRNRKPATVDLPEKNPELRERFCRKELSANAERKRAGHPCRAKVNSHTTLTIRCTLDKRYVDGKRGEMKSGEGLRLAHARSVATRGREYRMLRQLKRIIGKSCRAKKRGGRLRPLPPRKATANKDKYRLLGGETSRKNIAKKLADQRPSGSLDRLYM